ncbi:fatty acyl-CoA reductase wat-like isoform X1 [Sitodiplosis mosellana]|nr:fatty acyl-CoA reductase wat-like isoform X1 [Sitodiplosis mosellana]XP_055327145.1 fatty acyl-CoA reductase wat-like isoform X1 [Sitodiplosis mosellana]
MKPIASLEDVVLSEKRPETVEEEFQACIRRINYMQMDLEDDIYEKSTISQYFKGKCVFLTGGAGFLGQLYIEKLLRIGASRIYCLLRPKKNLTPEERIRHICSGPVYQRLRDMDPHFHDRLSVITGDLKLVGAGISATDVELLCNEVQVVIHAAADVRFNIPLLELVQSNVRGTRDVLEIAKKMKRLEVFSYISTAYSHCPRDIVEEKFYDPPMEPEFWLKVLDRCKTSADREIIEILEQQFMNPWPNSYTYTKALSESLVKRYSAHFPTIVIRPSIIVSTYQDPIPGWTNNITGINGLCVGIGVGFLRHLHVSNDFVIDIICADFVINTTLSAIYLSAEKYATLKRIPDPEVFHVTSKGFYLTSERLGQDSITIRRYELLHCMKCVYYPVITFTHYEWQDFLATIFLQALPCFFMDFFNPEKIRLLAVCRKIKSMKNVITFFMNKRIHFDNTNVVHEVYDRMTDVDKKLFPSDSRNFEWNNFLYAYFAGMRVYVLMDPLETFPKSRAKLRKLKYIHYTLKYSFFTILVLLFYVFVLKWLLRSLL